MKIETRITEAVQAIVEELYGQPVPEKMVQLQDKGFFFAKGTKTPVLTKINQWGGVIIIKICTFAAQWYVIAQI